MEQNTTSLYSKLHKSSIFIDSDLSFMSDEWMNQDYFLKLPKVGDRLSDIFSHEIVDQLLPLLYSADGEAGNYLQSEVFEINTGDGVHFIRIIAATTIENQVAGFKVYFDELSIPPQIASRIFRERSLSDDMLGEDREARMAKRLLKTEEELYERTKELQTTNEELIVTNEELNTINDELYEINQHLSVQSKHLKAILDNAIQGFLLLDCEMRVVSFNNKVVEWADRLYGEQIQEGTSFRKFFSQQESLHHLLEIFEKRQTFHDNIVEIDAEGRKFILNVSATPIQDYDDSLLYYLYSIQDVSEQKYQEEVVSSVFNTDNGAICQIDEKGVIKRANQGMANLFGYDLEELLDHPIFTLMPNEAEGRLFDFYGGLLSKAKRKGQKVTDSLTWEGKKNGGEIIFLNTTFIIDRSVDETYFGILSTKDITNEVQSSTMLNEMQHLIHAGGWVMDRLKGTIKWTEEVFNILGVSYKDRNPDTIEILSFFSEESRELLNESLKKAVSEFEPFDMELEIFTKNNLRKWVRTTGRPMVLNGTVYRIFGAFQDITSIKETENTLQIQNNELKKTNNYLDKFLYSTAHDLRAPVTSVLGLINLMKFEEPEKVVKDYLPMMESSVVRLDELITDISTFLKNSRTPIMTFETLNMESEIEKIFKDLTFMNGSIHMHKTLHIEDNGIEFKSDKVKITSIFSNLISNAYRYCDLRKEQQKVSVDIKITKKRLVAEIEDNGEGIPSDQLDKIFQMFYRATENKTGSGLGLYIVKDALETLKGSVMVDSDLGKWTRFTIEIPNGADQR